MQSREVVLITGGTGSFGRSMARRLLDLGCDEIRIFSRDEVKQEAMRLEFGSDALRFYIGDVRDEGGLSRAMHGVDRVFHAAALKQVPSCEFFPMEAVKTNVLGSINVVMGAVRADVKSVVCLSTDKAVQPVNAMGMSKALMEKMVVAESRVRATGDTVVSCVRYGNVLYSRGSVVPLFVKQALAGEALTVTDDRMTRFMMDLPEAVQLVELAFERARHGDLFIRKSPGALITEVATAVCTLTGSTSPIRKIGVRHGEKLHETLATVAELRHGEDLGGYYRISMDDRDLDYDKYFVEGEQLPEAAEDFTSASARRMAQPEIEEMLSGVPEIADVILRPSAERHLT